MAHIGAAVPLPAMLTFLPLDDIWIAAVTRCDIKFVKAIIGPLALY